MVKEKTKEWLERIERENERIVNFSTLQFHVEFGAKHPVRIEQKWLNIGPSSAITEHQGV